MTIYTQCLTLSLPLKNRSNRNRVRARPVPEIVPWSCLGEDSEPQPEGKGNVSEKYDPFTLKIHNMMHKNM